MRPLQTIRGCETLRLKPIRLEQVLTRVRRRSHHTRRSVSVTSACALNTRSMSLALTWACGLAVLCIALAAWGPRGTATHSTHRSAPGVLAQAPTDATV